MSGGALVDPAVSGQSGNALPLGTADPAIDPRDMNQWHEVKQRHGRGIVPQFLESAQNPLVLGLGGLRHLHVPRFGSLMPVHLVDLVDVELVEVLSVAPYLTGSVPHTKSLGFRPFQS